MICQKTSARGAGTLIAGKLSLLRCDPALLGSMLQGYFRSSIGVNSSRSNEFQTEALSSDRLVAAFMPMDYRSIAFL
jgi:hypothetical protein